MMWKHICLGRSRRLVCMDGWRYGVGTFGSWRMAAACCFSVNIDILMMSQVAGTVDSGKLTTRSTLWLALAEMPAMRD